MAKKISSMAIVVTLAQKSGRVPYCGTTTAKRSGIKSITVLPRQKTLPPVPGLRLSAMSTKNPPSEQKSSTVFAVVKGRFRHRKTRYRGLQKQTAKLNMVFALANLILADRPCLAA